MDGSRQLLHTLPLLLLLLLLRISHAVSYDFWNPANTNVELPNHFLIDERHHAIIVTAKNSVCHLTLNLTSQFNFHDASPDASTQMTCVQNTFNPELCQNYHHILLYPSGPGTLTAIGGQQYNLTDTVLVCGSNAYSPQCHFRERSSLTIVHTEQGVGFCPYRQSPVTSALWTSTSRLISSAPQLPNRVDGVVVSLSNTPYDGEVEVSTVKDSSWLNKSPQFVSMYEVGEYIYMFFREEAVETTRPILYSRVARVCKNETGAASPSNDNTIIFTTFLKARIKCSSGSGMNGDLPFHFNNLHDTFYLPSGSFDGTTTGKHLYGIFTSSQNGPVGSAVCVFTFDTHPNDLHRVFNGRYLQRRGTTNWVPVPNIPFTCGSRRNASEAERIQLMELPVEQSNGPRPIIQLSGYLFQKVTVDSVQSVNGTIYETLFIAAYKNNDVVLLKVTYVPSRTGNNYHISQSMVLKPYPPQNTTSLPEITQIKLLGTGPQAHVYVGTTTGIYRVPTSQCGNYTDCCSCVEARDPYCAYDAAAQRCVAVDANQGGSSTLIQDVVNGGTGQCGKPSVTPSSPTVSATTTVDMMTTATTQTDSPTTTDTNSTSTDTSSQSTLAHETSTTGQPSPTPQYPPTTPATEAISTAKTTQYDHTWTIVGAVSSFVGGVVLGILLMAVFYNRKNFLWSKYFPDRRSHDDREKGGAQGYSYRSNTSASNHNSKEDEFTKNNLEFNIQTETPEKFQSFQYHPTTENLYCKTPCTPIPHPIPTPPYNPRSAATSPYRSMASKPPSLNLKSNFRAEEHLTNREREVYGKNIVARMPSIDTSSKTGLHLQNGHTHRLPVSYNAHGGGFVQIHDSEIGCSDC